MGAPPPIGYTLREGLALPKLVFNPLRMPRKGVKIGRGRPVLVIPGLATGDISTTLLRRTLRSRGFAPEGWRLGVNTGGKAEKLARLEARVAQLHRQSGHKPIVIGWSLGGLYARVLGHRAPAEIAMVITVGSPFSGDRHANHGWRVYEALNDHTVDNPPFAEDFSMKPPVPTIAIWSAVDGIVAPESARGLAEQSDIAIRIDMQHFALGASHAAIDRLIAAIGQTDVMFA